MNQNNCPVSLISSGQEANLALVNDAGIWRQKKLPMYVIIQCSVKKKAKPAINWSGKEWSDLPCKIYSSMDEAMDAIKHYWYGSYNLDEKHDHRRITFIPLTEKKMQKMIADGKARL